MTDPSGTTEKVRLQVRCVGLDASSRGDLRVVQSTGSCNRSRPPRSAVIHFRRSATSGLNQGFSAQELSSGWQPNPAGTVDSVRISAICSTPAGPRTAEMARGCRERAINFLAVKP